MNDKSKIVIDVLKKVVNKKNSRLITPQANLRQELGIDSIKMIAISAMLVEKGIDVISAGSKADFTTIETVQDMIDIANEL